MEKKDFLNEVNRMMVLANAMPSSINEALECNECGGLQCECDDTDVKEEPVDVNPVNEPHDTKAFIAKIRKSVLVKMAEISDNPDDSDYQTLKKIWQICEKNDSAKLDESHIS